jgi:hypothetical protein
LRTTTLKFVVHGDNYEELTSAADTAIEKFLRSAEDEFDFGDDYEPETRHSINYELVVSESEDLSSDYEYTAEVIARIKDVR